MMNNRNRYSRETEQHKQAFELYYRLGPKRKYATVAAEFDRSVSTIKNWSCAFNWRQRIEEREAERMRLAGRSDVSDRLTLAKQFLTFVKAAQASTMRDMVEGKTKPTGKMLWEAIEERIAMEPGFDYNGAPPVSIIIYAHDK